MKRIIMVLLGLSLLFEMGQPLQADNLSQTSASAVDMMGQEKKNRELFERVLTKLAPEASLPMNELVVRVALEFVGTEYKSSTLDIVPEELRVFLDKTDCILFVQMSVCFALTIKGKKIVQAGDGEHYRVRTDSVGQLMPSVVDAQPSYELLCHNIQNMQYRLGKVMGYCSRMHYTSEWILQNEANGLLREYTQNLGQEMKQEFYFMSMHPNLYFQLMDDPCELGCIRMIELRLNAQKPFYILKSKDLQRKEIIEQIVNGDIITIVSSQPGLDVGHVAIAYEVDGEMHFIHASLTHKKVVIEKTKLADFPNIGIRVARLALID